MAINQKYVPIVKTTDAELRGIRHLADPLRANILPVFELTRSRTTVSSPDGDIGKRLDAIKEIQKEFPFILDLTGHEDLTNVQIHALQQEENGFEAWRRFVRSLGLKNLIPVIHAVEGGDAANLVRQVGELAESFDVLAFRGDAADPNVPEYLKKISETLGGLGRVIVVIDAGFLRLPAVPAVSASLIAQVERVCEVAIPRAVVPSSSAFPQAVAQGGYGQDKDGRFPIAELEAFGLVKKAVAAAPLVYGDHASIHPDRYPTRGGAWVPRVDAPLAAEYIYYRYRRDDGGYVTAATKLLNDKSYVDAGSWGDEQIRLAAAGAPNGRSPSFWISVRENIHLTRRGA